MSDLNLKRFMKLLAFVSCVAIALVLVLGKVLPVLGASAIGNAIKIVGECLAYIVTMVTAFGYVQSKRKPIWSIVYAISVTVIVIMLILNLF